MMATVGLYAGEETTADRTARALADLADTRAQLSIEERPLVQLTPSARPTRFLCVLYPDDCWGYENYTPPPWRKEGEE